MEGAELKREMTEGGGVFIIKPDGGAQGRGILLTRSYERVVSTQTKEGRDKQLLVQDYLRSPLLIDGLKFDLRVYLLVTSVTPLRIRLFDDGLCRLCTVPYAKPRCKTGQGRGDLDDPRMHLTNYAVQKGADEFVDGGADGRTGHKRSVQWFLQHAADALGADPEKLWGRVADLCVKTVLASAPQLRREYRWPTDTDSVCFALLGIDLMLDEALQPWLIEVNHLPSLRTDSAFDEAIKTRLVNDLMTALDVKAGDGEKHRRAASNSSRQRLTRARSAASAASAAAEKVRVPCAAARPPRVDPPRAVPVTPPCVAPPRPASTRPAPAPHPTRPPPTHPPSLSQAATPLPATEGPTTDLLVRELFGAETDTEPTRVGGFDLVFPPRADGLTAGADYAPFVHFAYETEARLLGGGQAASNRTPSPSPSALSASGSAGPDHGAPAVAGSPAPRPSSGGAPRDWKREAARRARRFAKVTEEKAAAAGANATPSGDGDGGGRGPGFGEADPFVENLAAQRSLASAPVSAAEREAAKEVLEAASRRLASANAESAEAVAVQARAIVEELNTSAAAATAQRYHAQHRDVAMAPSRRLLDDRAPERPPRAPQLQSQLPSFEPALERSLQIQSGEHERRERPPPHGGGGGTTATRGSRSASSTPHARAPQRIIATHAAIAAGASVPAGTSMSNNPSRALLSPRSVAFTDSQTSAALVAAAIAASAIDSEAYQFQPPPMALAGGQVAHAPRPSGRRCIEFANGDPRALSRRHSGSDSSRAAAPLSDATAALLPRVEIARRPKPAADLPDRVYQAPPHHRPAASGPAYYGTEFVPATVRNPASLWAVAAPGRSRAKSKASQQQHQQHQQQQQQGRGDRSGSAPSRSRSRAARGGSASLGRGVVVTGTAAGLGL